MEGIYNYFKALVGITDDDWQVFASKLVKKHYKKKSVILQSGKTEQYLSFIEKGIVRFNIPRPDYDFTFAFAFEGTFVSAYDSFLSRQPATYNMEAVADCTLWVISHEHLQEVYRCTDIGERIGRLIAEGIYLKKMKRELSLLEDTATKRYLDMVAEQPQLIQAIPLKYLASYIGIRPQSLSRIRRDLLTNVH
ncbi:Crp/Fnr family transcriptional regulator [Emticicia sp. TH156]|uniref:Crp/Fnr family transcriptional regulator n=1 Tax=Emticicia sp. TH156 TaxID=2067454 RepID=UPI000C7800F9|nr:Crp/Fnr family transcriptional regulator [Emticicia sp. TH156]PLK44444.1 CarD family transcriptional regulator [Emticicia sp. TH156]